MRRICCVIGLGRFMLIEINYTIFTHDHNAFRFNLSNEMFVLPSGFDDVVGVM